jgi:HEPN superfamily RiboL-PSP-like protein
MNIRRVEAAFEYCEEHLAQTNAYNTEIEAILARYVSSVIYAAFEAQIRTIVATRCAGDGSDSHLGSFTQITANRIIRSIKISEVSGIAGLFHKDCKDKFHALLDSQAKTAWESIINSRHDIAHESDSQGVVSTVTFRDLRELYPQALLVLDALRNAIERPQHSSSSASAEGKDRDATEDQNGLSWQARG